MIHRRLHPLHVIILVATFGAGGAARWRPESRAGRRRRDGGAGGQDFRRMAGHHAGQLWRLAPPGRCNAQQKVSLTVVEGEGSKVTGSYQCSYGSQDCFHQSTTGKVIEATLADEPAFDSGADAGRR